MMRMSRVVVVVSMAVAGLVLSGCGLGRGSEQVTVKGAAFQGSVYGGQQPIAGAKIQLYAAGQTGYASAYPYATGTSLLGTNVVTTDSHGNFSITGDYTCPSATTQVYIVSTGGNPGLPGNVNNAQIALMTALGACGNLTPATFIHINELTTVASVWALAPFMGGIANVGSSATNGTGLVNAFATVNKLVNTATGVAPGPALSAGAIAPVAKLNTLANILAACANSSGGAAGDGTPCGTLMSNTTVNGVVPADTVSAALSLARHPNLQTVALTNLSTGTAPFQPSLSVAPASYSLVVTYSGGGLNAPKGVAVDTGGNVWIANSGGNSVTELANSGVALSGSAGFPVGASTAPAGIAVDSSGNAWVANTGNNSVVKLNSAGAVVSTFSGGGLNAPVALAADVPGNIWVANSGSAVLTRIDTSGGVSGFVGAGVSSAMGIAVNPK